MDLALNNPQRLICQKKKTTNQRRIYILKSLYSLLFICYASLGISASYYLLTSAFEKKICREHKHYKSNF